MRERAEKLLEAEAARVERFHACADDPKLRAEYDKIQTQMEKLPLDDAKESNRLAAIRDSIIPRKGARLVGHQLGARFSQFRLGSERTQWGLTPDLHQHSRNAG